MCFIEEEFRIPNQSPATKSALTSCQTGLNCSLSDPGTAECWRVGWLWHGVGMPCRWLGLRQWRMSVLQQMIWLNFCFDYQLQTVRQSCNKYRYFLWELFGKKKKKEDVLTSNCMTAGLYSRNVLREDVISLLLPWTCIFEHWSLILWQFRLLLENNVEVAIISGVLSIPRKFLEFNSIKLFR